MFVVASHESLVGGCLPRARPQLTQSRRSLDHVDLRLVLFPLASPPNAHRGIKSGPLKKAELDDKSVQLGFFI